MWNIQNREICSDGKENSGWLGLGVGGYGMLGLGSNYLMMIGYPEGMKTLKLERCGSYITL